MPRTYSKALSPARSSVPPASATALPFPIVAWPAALRRSARYCTSKPLSTSTPSTAHRSTCCSSCWCRRRQLTRISNCCARSPACSTARMYANVYARPTVAKISIRLWWTFRTVNDMRLIIVSGRSGSGKSTALDVLEDNGFYCIDNLPAGLLPDLAERFLPHSDLLLPQVAVSIDARNLLSQLKRFPELLEEVRKRNIRCDVLYLDAEDETLLKRFSETRRRHPLTNDNRSLAEAIAYERQLLAPITDRADLKIDTTRLNLYQLRDTLKLRLLGQTQTGTAFLVESFGFKRGMPVDADLVFDARCLPNPYWKPELRDYSGLDQPVVDYLAAQPEVEELYQDILAYPGKWLPRFAASNRAYVATALGCTGGHHRSVYLANRLSQALKDSLKNVQVRHRDLS